MSDPFGSLPEPAPLRRAATITYQWGDQHFEIFCSACSIRTLTWPKTDEEVTWLHCKAMRTAEIKPDGPTGMMTVLIPAHYVTSIGPGPTFRVDRIRITKDIGIFPPSQPTPVDRLPLERIEETIADLMRPERN
jgi:hypothetical protein